MATSGDVTQFTRVDALAAPRTLIDFLDLGRTVEGIQQVKGESVMQLNLAPGHRVLDVGCGTGEEVHTLAQAVGPQGQAVGIDVSGAMIQEARCRHAGCGLPVVFSVSDAQHLAFADAAFDGCRMERVIMYQPRPEQALAEMVRVVRPGGRVVVFDFDWGTTFIDHPDVHTTRQVIEAFSDRVPHGWIGRRLPRLCQAAGWVAITCVPHVVQIPYSVARQMLEGAVAAAQAEGQISTQALTAWWAYLETTAVAGQSYIGQVGFMVTGTKSALAG